MVGKDVDGSTPATCSLASSILKGWPQKHRERRSFEPGNLKDERARFAQQQRGGLHGLILRMSRQHCALCREVRPEWRMDAQTELDLLIVPLLSGTHREPCGAGRPLGLMHWVACPCACCAQQLATAAPHTSASQASSGRQGATRATPGP